jgi:hypothetical protein
MVVNVNVIWSRLHRAYGVLVDGSDPITAQWFRTHAEAAASAAHLAERTKSLVVDGSPRGYAAVEALFGV